MNKDENSENISNDCILSCYGCFNSKSNAVETQELQFERAEEEGPEKMETKPESRAKQDVMKPALVPDKLLTESKNENALQVSLNQQNTVLIEANEVGNNEMDKELENDEGENKNVDKIAEKEFAKYTGSQTYKISKQHSEEDIQEEQDEYKEINKDFSNTFRPTKTTKIETLHDKMIGSLLVKETKKYEVNEYNGNKTSKILHTKILGDQSYQTEVLLENDIQTQSHVITEMNEEEIIQFQKKWEDLMKTSLMEMIEQAIKNMPNEEDM